jgi:hypothetical protein
VHTASVLPVNVTGKPELAVAIKANEPAARRVSAGLTNVIVCPFDSTVKDWVTVVAAPHVLLPDWSAATVHVPTVRNVTVDPDTVHTAVVLLVKVTASVELAVALTVNGADDNERSPRGPNVIVWLVVVTWND